MIPEDNELKISEDKKRYIITQKVLVTPPAGTTIMVDDGKGNLTPAPTLEKNLDDGIDHTGGFIPRIKRPYEDMYCMIGSASRNSYTMCKGPECGHWDNRAKKCGFAMIGEIPLSLHTINNEHNNATLAQWLTLLCFIAILIVLLIHG